MTDGSDGDLPAVFGSTGFGAAALGLVALLAFWPVISGARSFFHLDLFYEHLPVWHQTQRALRAGQSPFWLDGEYCGQPPLFHQEAPLFYPPTVPLLLTGAPVHRLADVFSLFHFWLAGFAAFLFLRAETRHAAASLFGGVAWMLSARMIQSAIWPNAVAVSALVPLVLLGIRGIGRGRSRGGALLAGVSGGLALLAARPHSVLAALPVIVAVGASALWIAPDRRRALRDLLVAGGLAALLGAPSVLPTAALLGDTSRGGGLARADRDARALSAGSDLDLVFLPRDGLSRWPEAAAYPGILAGALFLAGLVFWIRGRGFPRALFAALLAAGLVGLVLAFGERGPYGLVANLPLLRSFRSPARYLFSWSLALALGSSLALAWALARLRRPWIAAASVVLLAVDLVGHARSSAPTAPSAVYAAEPAIVPLLRRRLGTDALGFPRRYVSLADAIYPVFYDDAALLVMIRNYEPLKMAIGMRFGLESVNGYGPTLRRTDALLAAWSPRAARLAGVGAIVTNPPPRPDEPPGQARGLVVEPFEGLPRAILVPEAHIVAPGLALDAALDPAFDPRQAVILEDGDPLPRGSGWQQRESSLRLISREPGRLDFEASLSDRGVLVVFDAWEAGWRAEVDGRPEPVERADGAFRGLRLPAGRHRVGLRYEPRGLKEGAGLGLVGILAAILAARRLPSGPDAGAPTPSGILPGNFA